MRDGMVYMLAAPGQHVKHKSPKYNCCNDPPPDGGTKCYGDFTLATEKSAQRFMNGPPTTVCFSRYDEVENASPVRGRHYAI